MEYYSAIKSKLIGTGIWMNLKIILGGKKPKTHTQKKLYDSIYRKLKNELDWQN